LSLADVLHLVTVHTDNHQIGELGEKTVNLLHLNLALDQLH
jgi:K+-transporting ATPase c subunit